MCQPTIEAVAQVVASFRSTNPEHGKSKEEYQDIFRRVNRQLRYRVATRKDRLLSAPPQHMKTALTAPWNPNDTSDAEQEEANRLRRTVLPSLNQTLRDLPLVMNPSKLENDTRSWFDAVLNQLIKIEHALEEIESSMNLMIWGSRRHNPNHISVLGHEIFIETQELLEGPFSKLIIACDTFFVGFNDSILSLNGGHPIHARWDELARLSTLTIAAIDTLIDWMPKRVLNMAKEDWELAVVNTWDMLQSINQPLHPIFYQFNNDYEDASDHEYIEMLGEIGMKCARASIPIIKLCRIFFNRLPQITNSQEMICIKHLVEMKTDRLGTFLISAGKTEARMDLRLARGMHDLSNTLYTLQSGMKTCYNVVKTYWDSLLERNDPEVNHKQIADGLLWLHHWTSAFSLATKNTFKAAGHEIPQSDTDDDSA